MTDISPDCFMLSTCFRRAVLARRRGRAAVCALSTRSSGGPQHQRVVSDVRNPTSADLPTVAAQPSWISGVCRACMKSDPSVPGLDFMRRPRDDLSVCLSVCESLVSDCFLLVLTKSVPPSVLCMSVCLSVCLCVCLCLISVCLSVLSAYACLWLWLSVSV